MHQNPKGFSCNSCQIQVLLGQRYKCLVCYDYDLCEKCYEHEAKINGHKTDHPFQGLITRSDPEDGVEESETLVNLKLPNYTCPICCSTGFTDGTLQDHVIADHKNNNFKVICPLCAAMPGRDPNLITDDFPGHLTLKHMHSESGRIYTSSPVNEDSANALAELEAQMAALSLSNDSNSSSGMSCLDPCLTPSPSSTDEEEDSSNLGYILILRYI